MIAIIALAGFTLFILERIKPNKPFVYSKNWYVRSILFNIITLLIFIIGSVSWEPWFQNVNALIPEINLNKPTQGFIVYITFQFVFYWWHRAKHRYKTLWKVFHQIHHSPQRIEVLASNYVHPFDTLSSLLIGSAITYWLFGFNLDVAAWFSLYLGVMGYFIHSNIKVPRWVGYVIQTPQMHRMHHEYAKHSSNYCDIVLFDMLFGTHLNPTEQEVCNKCGFDSNKELKIKEMLLCKDVHKKANKKIN
jgi:sterol desaturase/sphingolipid hydroxylase (fatty acid hydroxylase superfamily)